MKNLLIGLAVLTVVGGGFYYYMNSGYEVVSIDILASGESGSIGQDIIILTEKLNSVTIDSNIFSEPMVLNLKDFSLDLYPESQGRSNPFAPIGIENISPNSRR